MIGNWTFVVVTDRVELDDQIAKTFKAVSAVSPVEGDRAPQSGPSASCWPATIATSSR